MFNKITKFIKKMYKKYQIPTVVIALLIAYFLLKKVKEGFEDTLVYDAMKLEIDGMVGLYTGDSWEWTNDDAGNVLTRVWKDLSGNGNDTISFLKEGQQVKKDQMD